MSDNRFNPLATTNNDNNENENDNNNNVEFTDIGANKLTNKTNELKNELKNLLERLIKNSNLNQKFYVEHITSLLNELSTTTGLYSNIENTSVEKILKDALDLAAIKGNFEIFKKIYEFFSEKNDTSMDEIEFIIVSKISNEEKNKLLFSAITSQQSSAQIVKLLLEEGVDPTEHMALNGKPSYPLWIAIASNPKNLNLRMIGILASYSKKNIGILEFVDNSFTLVEENELKGYIYNITGQELKFIKYAELLAGFLNQNNKELPWVFNKKDLRQEVLDQLESKNIELKNMFYRLDKLCISMVDFISEYDTKRNTRRVDSIKLLLSWISTVYRACNDDLNNISSIEQQFLLLCDNLTKQINCEHKLEGDFSVFGTRSELEKGLKEKLAEHDKLIKLQSANLIKNKARLDASMEDDNDNNNDNTKSDIKSDANHSIAWNEQILKVLLQKLPKQWSEFLLNAISIRRAQLELDTIYPKLKFETQIESVYKNEKANAMLKLAENIVNYEGGLKNFPAENIEAVKEKYCSMVLPVIKASKERSIVGSNTANALTNFVNNLGYENLLQNDQKKRNSTNNNAFFYPNNDNNNNGNNNNNNYKTSNKK